MKKYVIFLTAAAIAFAAVAIHAQQARPNQFEKLRSGPRQPIATMKHNLLVLYTGKPLTEAEKRDFLAKAALQFRGVPLKWGVTVPAVQTISPANMDTPSFQAAGNLVGWDPEFKSVMVPSDRGALNLFVNANPNHLYLVTMKVRVYADPGQITIWPVAMSSGVIQSQVVNVTGDPVNGTDQEFAFAFDTDTSGYAEFDILINNHQYYFTSAELMAQ